MLCRLGLSAFFSAAGNVVTIKCNKLEDDTVDAPVLSDGWHGLMRSSGISQEALGMKDKNFCFSCGSDGWVPEYVYKLFLVALCGIVMLMRPCFVYGAEKPL